MRKLNLYYIVSIITLAFMIIILFRTLQVTGWFEEHQGKSPAERVLQNYPGEYQLTMPGDEPGHLLVGVEPYKVSGENGWLMIRLDSLPRYLINVSDFEDDQILIEIYHVDSTGGQSRLEGCELLLNEDDAENFVGSTIGDFCGLKEQSSEYLALDLLLSGPIVSLKIQTGVLGQADSSEAKKYLLERLIHGRE
ncbi:MAG: hypothetical protein HN995_03925 [Candidatus Marinimicrobia bacterium]|jgi:hypothetical protein|nr:hypothetical protein [Candidatus Neomarinimicrobiota bacterium]MBT3576001.1 hypothetical protein [Candidatus Neomarinimicrobiota bacterium]MBT3680507.1 hypothetical protein [Candidatus Neomarinimicrobiota bacterium]MBT3949448.1 hypothetical protein [Candidatus Neomarinimicrobiota bacterium]MBT4253856.1 hypothetical protein [Candidatus Neomarinimicrobiota bacterium]